MNTAGLPARARHARRVGFAAWAALIVLECLWHAWWQAPVHPPGLALAIVPLLLPLLALRRPLRALLWAGIIAVFYFGHGISDAWTMPAWRVPAIIEAVLAVILVGAVGGAMPRRETIGTRDPGPGTRQHSAGRK